MTQIQNARHAKFFDLFQGFELQITTNSSKRLHHLLSSLVSFPLLACFVVTPCRKVEKFLLWYHEQNKCIFENYHVYDFKTN